MIDKNDTQYFIDGAYKCVPHSLDSVKVLLLLIAYNAELKQFELALAATFNKEDTDIYMQFYSFIKSKYNFNPDFITCDFSKSNIAAINKIFEKSLIITCFFHLIQCWWRKASILKLRKKAIVNKTRILIYNLKLLAFMDIDSAIDFYETIKTTFNQDQFNEFFDYFETTWLNPNKDIKTKYEFNLWSYYGKFNFKTQRKKFLISEQALDEYIFLSNNACESCNNLINNYIEINSKVGLSKFETILKS